VVLFVYAGALLGSLPVVRQHLGWLALAIVVLSLLPIVFGALKARRAARG
jgi:membrane-associated protein